MFVKCKDVQVQSFAIFNCILRWHWWQKLVFTARFILGDFYQFKYTDSENHSSFSLIMSTFSAFYMTHFTEFSHIATHFVQLLKSSVYVLKHISICA